MKALIEDDVDGDGDDGRDNEGGSGSEKSRHRKSQRQRHRQQSSRMSAKDALAMKVKDDCVCRPRYPHSLTLSDSNSYSSVPTNKTCESSLPVGRHCCTDIHIDSFTFVRYVALV